MKYDRTPSPLTDREVELSVSNSLARSKEKREQPSRASTVWGARIAVGAAAGTLMVLGLRAANGNKQASTASPEGSGDNVPAATASYLEGRPTVEVTIPAGGGIDDAAYAANPNTFDDTTPDIRAGVEAMIQDEVITETGGKLPQAGEAVEVPVVPPTQSIPPAAR